MSPSSSSVEPVQVSPLEILLDPNSYRLVDDPRWARIADDQISDPQVQSEVFAAVVSESRFRLRYLRTSMKAYGWLEIDPPWVRKLDDGRFVAVDGNRRLAAWQIIHGSHHQLPLFGQNVLNHQIMVNVVTDVESGESTRLLGLRHLLPPAAWSSLGLAVWREQYRAAHGESPDQHVRRPYRRHRAEIEDQALQLAHRYSDQWGQDAGSNLYNVLLEALSQRRIAAWLSVDGEALDDSRVARFLDWLAPTDPDDHGDDDDSQPSRQGGNTLFRVPGVRQLAALLDDPEMVAKLDAGADPGKLIRAYASREIVEPDDYLHPWVDTQIARSGQLDSGKAQDALSRLREALRRSNEEPVESGTHHPWDLMDTAEQPVCLKSLTVNDYRGLTKVSLRQFQRINLLVGVNNAGKTSLLEAIYLLSRLSDPRGLLDTLRIRTRQDPERDPSFLSDLIETLKIDIQAVDGNARELSLKLSRLPPPDGVDLSAHISGMRLDAYVDDALYATTTELSSQRARRTLQVAGKNRWLAHGVLHSPYSRLDRAAVMRCYKASVEAKSLMVLMSALREAVDPKINDIRLVSESGRFVVEHCDRPPMDISAYGEGLQRMFEIGLLFAAHSGGFVLIDELETALHPSALLRFTKLVQELAVRFDVQAFITTHSKETVDAFLFNGYEIDDIAAFLLKRTDYNAVNIRRFSGPKLKYAVEVGDVDIRRL